MRELTAARADDLCELVCARAAAGHSLVLTSNRCLIDWYPLFPNPFVAESLLGRLINTSHEVFMNGPSCRPKQRRPIDEGDHRVEHHQDLRNYLSAGQRNFVSAHTLAHRTCCTGCAYRLERM